MRLSHLRPSSDHRRRSSGNLSLDSSSTLYVTQQGHVGHVSVSDHVVSHGNLTGHDVSRRVSIPAAKSSPVRGATPPHRLSLQAPELNVRRRSITPLPPSREDSAEKDDIFRFSAMAKIEDNYNLNVFRIKVLCIIFVVVLVISVSIVLYRRAMIHTSVNI